VLMVFIVSVFLLSAEYSDSIWHYQGLPLPLFKWGGPGNVSRDHAYSSLYLIFVDMIFWYLLGCLLAWLITLAYYTVYRQ